MKHRNILIITIMIIYTVFTYRYILISFQEGIPTLLGPIKALLVKIYYKDENIEPNCGTYGYNVKISYVLRSILVLIFRVQNLCGEVFGIESNIENDAKGFIVECCEHSP